MSQRVRIAIIGAGAVADYHHVPGIHLDPRAELVAACDPNEALLAKRRGDWNISKTTTDYRAIAADPEIDAVIICTPNDTHHPITLACLAGGKHVMCEKPLGLNFQESQEMFRAAKDRGLRHMTAFTYRFAPSMRYLRHLLYAGSLGTPRHFRSQRFLDWPETSWGWRQSKKLAGAGDLFDMTIHRIDYAQDLMGRMVSITGAVAQFAPRNVTPQGDPCSPSEVDDWSALICLFDRGGVGVLEGTTLAKGYHYDGFGHDWAEVNGSEATAVYQLKEP
ncbi:MAG: Gfo/Idh/MocA family oxidoreductase, partial [Planctomycetota bacterium]|nr:Gfo/Idh/MocA family oxidoreductase [Planctomycetota bacterium]